MTITRTESQVAMSPSGLSVALIMPAHKLGPDLDASVRSVERLDPQPDEFVIVVDGNPDVTGHVGQRHRAVQIRPSGPAAARNAGVAATSSDVVLFVDSDIVVPTDLIASVRAAMSAPGAGGAPIDALIGSYDAAPSVTTTVSQFRNLLHHWTHQQAEGRGHTFWGACGAVRRSAFDAVGGFDESYDDATIEDIELGERLTAAGFRIEVVPSIQVKHLKHWTLWGMIHTDVTKRGIPWSRLILRRGEMADDLNTTRAARVTVAMAGLLGAVALAAIFGPGGVLRRRARVAAAGLATLLSWRDRRFLRFLARARSVAFAARAAPLLWIHHLSAGVSFAWALVTWPWHRPRPHVQ